MQPEDRQECLRMRLALYPEFEPEQIETGLDDFAARPDSQRVFVAEEGGGLVGFIEVALREWAHGCVTSPVGYIESWYVSPDMRRSGVGRELVLAAENWTREKGCSEIGSDCDLDNDISNLAHESLGYRECLRHIHFAKRLS